MKHLSPELLLVVFYIIVGICSTWYGIKKLRITRGKIYLAIGILLLLISIALVYHLISVAANLQLVGK